MNALFLLLVGTATASELDDTIAERVADVLVDHGVDARVAFDIDDGQVTLLGSLASASDEARLIAAVEKTPGVVDVTDSIDTPDLGVGLSAMTTTQPDQEVADTDRADELLDATKGLDTTAILVMAEGSTLVLTGRVETKRQRKLAARALADFGSVRNELVVVPAN